jgi:Arylmalonate decarboxylase
MAGSRWRLWMDVRWINSIRPAVCLLRAVGPSSRENQARPIEMRPASKHTQSCSLDRADAAIDDEPYDLAGLGLGRQGDVGGAISVLEASIEMLRRTDARSIGLFTPYVPALTQSVADSFTAEGFAVVETHSLGLRDNAAIGNLAPPRIQDSVVSAMKDTVLDAIFMSCTNLRAVEAITSISARLGVPVISSNSAVARVVQEHLAGEHAVARISPRC